MTRTRLLVPAAVLLFAAGCGPAPATSSGEPSPAAPPGTSVAPLAPSPAAPPVAPAVPGQQATVVDVVDGDTAKVRTDDGQQLTIRVLGIDTPEVYGGAECWGTEASAFAQQTLAGQTVGLVADATQDDTDRYGRTLRYLVLPGGGNYSVLAAQAGAARSYVYGGTPVSEYEAIVAAEQAARQADRGLWGACGGPEPTTSPAPEPAGGGVGSAPGDLDCSDLSGPVDVAPGDPDRLDSDGDGVGCE